MPRGHGKNLSFKVDDSSGSLRDISQDVTGVSGLPGGRALSDATGAGDAGDRSVPGRASASFTVSGWFDTRATTGSYVVLSGLRTTTATASFEYGPLGTTTLLPKETGECWLETLTYDATIEGTVPFSAQFKLDGVSTAGAF